MSVLRIDSLLHISLTEKRIQYVKFFQQKDYFYVPNSSDTVTRTVVVIGRCTHIYLPFYFSTRIRIFESYEIRE